MQAREQGAHVGAVSQHAGGTDRERAFVVHRLGDAVDGQDALDSGRLAGSRERIELLADEGGVQGDRVRRVPLAEIRP